MIHTLKTLGLPLILTASLMAARASAQATDGPPASDPKIDQLGRALLEAKQEATTLRLKIEQLQSHLDSLARGERPATVVTNYPNDLARDMAEIKRQLESLRLDVDSLKRNTTVTVLKPIFTTGRVRLVNNYPDAMNVVVNQDVIRLMPYKHRDLTLGAGPFTYFVEGVQSQLQNRTLAANEMQTITIRPLGQ